MKRLAKPIVYFINTDGAIIKFTNSLKGLE